MSKTIENIRLYRINNGAHYHFMETVATKAKTDEKVKAKAVLLVTALEQAVKTENDNLLLSQKSAQRDAIAEADRQHDNFYRGYRNGVKSFLSFPDGMRQAVAKQLWQHMGDYKIDPRMQLDRETELLTNFIEDLVSDRGAYAEIEGDGDYAVFIDFVNQQIAQYKEQVLPSPAKGKNGKSGKTGKSSQSASHAEELARLKAMIAEYELSSHFTPGIVVFTGLAAGKDATRAYQVYLSNQPTDLFWLTVKNGKLTEIEFKVQPGQPGGLEMEKIK